MKKNVIFISILLTSVLGFSQQKEGLGFNRDTIRKGSMPTIKSNFKEKSKGKKIGLEEEKNKEKPIISEYKIISFENDTTYVDTTLTIQRDYNFNYLRRDDFGLQPINNVGQTHTSLEKVVEKNHLLPLFGARARHFNFIEAESVNYYNVPTPLTELYFKTTFEQGQQLDAFLTVNTSPRLNISIAYKGIRSLGKYQHALTSSGNFRTTASYKTKNDRYQLRTHFVAQNLLNEENGGLSFIPGEGDSFSGIDQYLGDADIVDSANGEQRNDFVDRGAITVNFEDAESTLRGKRFYVDHKYHIIKKGDSTANEFSIGHILDLTDKSFQYKQTIASDLYGDSYESGALFDKVALEDFTNTAYIDYKNSWFGNLRISAGLTDYNYGYNSTLLQVDEISGVETRIENRLKGGVSFVGGKYSNTYKGFSLSADGMSIVSGSLNGSYLNMGIGYDFSNKYGLYISMHNSSVAPNYNFLLHQSDYKNYNWQNNDFKNVTTKKVSVTVNAKKIASIKASYRKIANYTYFSKTEGADVSLGDSLTTPMQYRKTIDLLKVKVSNSFRILKWLGFDNTILYQNVSSGNEVYKVPNIITRNSMYYEDQWFRKALFLQTGVIFKYYSAYTADGYDPVLSEFYVQSNSEQEYFKNEGHTFGGFPQFDLFFNAKIKQTRIYFKVENFGEAFGQSTQNREFSAPGYAPRDAVIRFGLVWNFFM